LEALEEALGELLLNQKKTLATAGGQETANLREVISTVKMML
jgi:hypothetical protein